MTEEQSDLIEEVRAWRMKIFEGRIEHDVETELNFLRVLANNCDVEQVAKVLKHWRKPTLSVAPGPRMAWRMSPETDAEIRENIKKLLGKKNEQQT